MTRNRKMLRRLALALGVLGLTVTAVAAATHIHPKGATPIRASLVPAFKKCTAPNRTHGAPLAFPSCAPPVEESKSLTVGTPDANGAGANSIGTAVVKVLNGSPRTLGITLSISDVRCKAGVTACGNANAADGADYTGELQGNATIRISDHWNAVAPGGGPDAATVIDIPFPVGATCANTADTAIGGLCSVNTSANVVVPGSVKDTKRAVIEVGVITITDGGADGLNGTAPNTLFETQGIFIP